MKRIISLFSALLLLCLTFSSCGGNGKNYPTVRIMSYNVLADCWSSEIADAHPVEERAGYLAETLNEIKPDVVGLQEMNDVGAPGKTPAWHAQFENNENLTTYKLAVSKFIGMTGSECYCGATLAYNSETTKLIASGAKAFSIGNIYWLRCVSWGVFEDIESGNRYIVTSTHFDASNCKCGTANANAEEYKDPKYLYPYCQQAQAKEMVDFIKDIRKTYPGIAVFCTGDYNGYYENGGRAVSNDEDLASGVYYLIKKMKLKDARLEAKTAEYTKESIDHILFFEDTNEKGNPLSDIVLFNRISNEKTQITSDHSPIYADVRLNYTKSGS